MADSVRLMAVSCIACLIVGNLTTVVTEALFDCRKLYQFGKSGTVEVIEDLNWLEAGVKLSQDIPNIFSAKQHVELKRSGEVRFFFFLFFFFCFVSCLILDMVIEWEKLLNKCTLCANTYGLSDGCG